MAALGQAAQDAGLKAGAPGERLVFVEGFARTGQWENARRQLTELAAYDFYRPAACRLLDALQQDGADAQQVRALQAAAGCTQP